MGTCRRNSSKIWWSHQWICFFFFVAKMNITKIEKPKCKRKVGIISVKQRFIVKLTAGSQFDCFHVHHQIANKRRRKAKTKNKNTTNNNNTYKCNPLILRNVRRTSADMWVWYSEYPRSILKVALNRFEFKSPVYRNWNETIKQDNYLMNILAPLLMNACVTQYFIEFFSFIYWLTTMLLLLFSSSTRFG